jgi:hypothetical protein
MQTTRRWDLEVRKSLALSSYDQCSSSALIAQLAGSPKPYELASRLLAKCQDQKSSILQSNSKSTKFNIYDHIAYQTAPYSNPLDRYCCRRTRHMTDSYPNFFYIAEHKLLAYLLESDLLFWSNHQSEDDKQNWSVIGHPRFRATSPKALE